MEAGKLRNAINLYHVTDTVDRVGNHTPTRTQYAKAWAMISTKSTREGMAITTLTIRYWPGIVPSDIATFGGRTFLVNGINDVEARHKTIELVCTEVLNG